MLECVLERLALELELWLGLLEGEGLWLFVCVGLLEIVLEIDELGVIDGVGLDDGGGPIYTLTVIPVSITEKSVYHFTYI